MTAAYRGLEMKLYDAQDTWVDINARLMRLEVNESAEFVEGNYEDSIAIYNESYETAIENYVSPNEDDVDLIPVPVPVVTLAPAPSASPTASSVILDPPGKELILDPSNVALM